MQTNQRLTHNIRLLAAVVTLLPTLILQAQNADPDSARATRDTTATSKPKVMNIREYTQENPLIYEDMWDLWPYAFLNENGEPDGFNVELIRIMMDELHIPYRIKLKEKQDAFEDLRDGKSDLILGLSAGYHDAYGLYSENPVTLFTQSVASPKDKPVEITTFKDLSKHKVFVNDSSLCHHLMIDYGWGENAIPYSAVRLALLKVSTENEGCVVWNTLSLKWLIEKYHIENLQVTPINMPHGEYKFMSNNPVLLHKLDSVYSALDSSDKLVDLRNKWFYPDHHETGIPSWVWWLAAAAGLIALIMAIYAIVYNHHSHKLTEFHNQRNKRLALILETSKVRVWTYQVATQLFEWRNENGQVAYTYTSDEFAHRYRPDDFAKLVKALHHLSATVVPPKKKDSGQKEEEITLEIKARDTEDGDAEEKDFTIVLSVLHRDKHGRATVILGTKRDMTELHHRQQLADKGVQRYWTIFNNQMQGNLRFSPDGILTNINKTACATLGCKPDELLEEKVSYKDLFELPDLDITQADGYRFTRTFDFVNHPSRKLKAIGRTEKLVLDIDLHLYHTESGELAGMMAMCRDITELQDKQKEVSLLAEKVKKSDETLKEYYAKIDTILRDGQIRMANYSPVSHTLTIYRSINEVQQTLTQTRCMTLVDEYSQNKAMHILNAMDERTEKEMHFDLRTTLSRHGDYPFHFRFSFVPVTDKDGQVTEYFGLCQDITEQKATDYKLLHEAKKVQEIENTKTSFINNMVEEIRTPMESIATAASDLAPLQDEAHSNQHCDVILKNSTYLLHLIDNILYLSRLEAHMIEVQKQPTDFVDTFTTYSVAGRLQSNNVTFTTESPYEQLVVDIDGPKLGNIIERVVENAVQHTQHGFIRARYDYIGRRLMISVEDTGDGISPKILKQLNEPGTDGARASGGLSIAICKELLAQMGGHIEINSEEGLGTTVWIIMPCHATIIRRKKMV